MVWKSILFLKHGNIQEQGMDNLCFLIVLRLINMAIFMLQIQEIIEFKNLVPLDIFITKWGEEGSADGQFSQLHHIAIHPNGKFIYTVELDESSRTKFLPNGTFISKFGYEKTGGDAEKRNPHQLYVDSSGNFILVIGETLRS